jgi:hypothetical protein
MNIVGASGHGMLTTNQKFMPEKETFDLDYAATNGGNLSKRKLITFKLS